MRLIKIRKTHIFLETHGSVFRAKQYDNDNGDASPCVSTLVWTIAKLMFGIRNMEKHFLP